MNASEKSIIAVGSGGSFTVASLLCSLHEAFTGRVSRPSTPLEIISNPTLASTSPVFLISAEGKNPDIVQAARRSRDSSSRSLHVITNREHSELVEASKDLPEVSSHIFPLIEKDGYLATNSLLLNTLLISRAYSELDENKYIFPGLISNLKVNKTSVDEWAKSSASFIKEVASRGALIVVYSPLLSPVAVDLESKLSESALVFSQFTDIRSFAHGRHLWLSDRPHDCAILAITDPMLEELWRSMERMLPDNIPTLTMSLPGVKPVDLLAGVVAQMKLLLALAEEMSKDPGRPNVPKLGRELHYADLSNLIPPFRIATCDPEHIKSQALGASWPYIRDSGPMNRALEIFQSDLLHQDFKAIVFDYDGTLAASSKREDPPNENVLALLQNLLDHEVIIGIASGRGTSLYKHLKSSFTNDQSAQIYLGLYNGGWIGTLDESVVKGQEVSEYISHVTRLVRRLRTHGIPIAGIHPTHPYQVSIRFKPGVQSEKMWFVIADTLRQAGLSVGSVVKSQHSVDILDQRINKSHLIDYIVRRNKFDPYQVLTMGDQGAWPGNDYSLLEHRYSLSVAYPSRRLDRGWKLAPLNLRNVSATIWYLNRFRLEAKGIFRFNLDADVKAIKGQE